MPRSSSMDISPQLFGAADVLVRVLRPRLVAELARPRHGVELPDELLPVTTSNARMSPGGEIQPSPGADPRMSRFCRRPCRDAWTAHRRAWPARDALAQVDEAVGAERQDRLAGPCVDRLKEGTGDQEQPPVAAVVALPVVDAASGEVRDVLVNPDFLAGGRVERDERVVPSEHEDEILDGDRIEPRFGVRVEPRDLELVQVGLPDLVEVGEVRAVRAAEVVPPPFVAAGREERARGDDGGEQAAMTTKVIRVRRRCHMDDCLPEDGVRS